MDLSLQTNAMGSSSIVLQAGSRRWHELLHPVFAFSNADLLAGDDAFAAWAARGAALSWSCHGQAEWTREPKPTNSPSFDQIAFRLVLSGSIDVVIQDLVHRVVAGSIVVLDLQKPFRLIHGIDGISEISLWLSPARLEPQQLENAHGRVLAGSSAVAVFTAALEILARETKRIGPVALENVNGGIARLAGDLLSIPAPVTSTIAPELESFVTICDYIEINLNARNLNPAMLARAFGLSRASLYRLFEPVGGVAGYIRSRRLEHARNVIKEPGLMNRRIAPVAYASGFKSIASFNRAYRQAYGETPRESRRGTAGAVPKGAFDERLGPLARCLLEIG